MALVPAETEASCAHIHNMKANEELCHIKTKGTGKITYINDAKTMGKKLARKESFKFLLLINSQYHKLDKVFVS